MDLAVLVCNLLGRIVAIDGGAIMADRQYFTTSRQPAPAIDTNSVRRCLGRDTHFPKETST
jgi:hypothetical protein